MKKILISLFTILTLCGGEFCGTLHAQTLREAFKDKFLIGAAINVRQVKSQDPKVQSLIKNQFSALVPENCMKAEEIHPKKDLYDWRDPDAIVALAEKNGQAITGHCLIWHSQCPYWFFKDDMGNEITKEELTARMKDHIYNVVGHYKGRIKGWDVVNEAIEGDGSFRNSQFYKILGKDFIRLAFQFAHEADPDAELYYNDYGMDGKAKRETVVALIKDLKAHGCRIDAVGMQSHVAFNSNLDAYEESINAFTAQGVKVMITELDLSVLPSPRMGFSGAAIDETYDYKKELNPYTEGLPKEKAQEQTDFFKKLFALYLKHKDDITRVTFWGLTDGDSWKNGWPVPFRTDYPLAFDRNYDPKPFVGEIIKLAKKY